MSDDAASAVAGNETVDVPARPGAGKPDPILVVDGATRSFGGVQAVNVEHLELQRGAITALIGPNGAGKTTLFNVLTGFDKADSGNIVFSGSSIDHLPPWRVAELGMVRSFQTPVGFPTLSVGESLMVAGSCKFESILKALLG